MSTENSRPVGALRFKSASPIAKQAGVGKVVVDKGLKDQRGRYTVVFAIPFHYDVVQSRLAQKLGLMARYSISNLSVTPIFISLTLMVRSYVI
jgi:hypothetical protein